MRKPKCVANIKRGRVEVVGDHVDIMLEGKAFRVSIVQYGEEIALSVNKVNDTMRIAPRYGNEVDIY